MIDVHPLKLIGLSVLQDLAHGMDSLDKEDDIQRRLKYSRWSVHSSRGIGKGDGGEATAYKPALAGRVSHAGYSSPRCSSSFLESVDDNAGKLLWFSFSASGVLIVIVVGV